MCFSCLCADRSIFCYRLYINFGTLPPFGSLWRLESKRGRIGGVTYWEIIADNLKKVGWSLGWVSAIDREGRTIWIVDAHCGDGKRLVVHADEKLTAFLELEAAAPASRSRCPRHRKRE
jgi:hypothetical protein